MSSFIKFLFAGGIAAIVNIVSRYILNKFMSFEVAIVIAYILGMITAFVISKYFVFDTHGKGHTETEFIRFTIVNAFALVVVWLVSVGLERVLFPAIQFTNHSKEIAHIVGVLSPVVTSYFGHKYFTFREGKNI